MQKIMTLILLMSTLLLPIRLAYGHNTSATQKRYTNECLQACRKLTGQVVARGAIACTYGCTLKASRLSAEGNCHSQAKAGYFDPHLHAGTPQLTCICYNAFVFSWHWPNLDTGKTIDTLGKFTTAYNVCWEE